MGVLIKIDGVNFAANAIGKVEITTCQHQYSHACDTTCNLCGAIRTVAHNYVDGYCTVCGKRDPDYLYTIADYPVNDTTLKGLYDLGGTAEASVVNHAPTPHINTKATELYGTVTVNEDYCTFTGTAAQAKVLTYLRMPLANAITAVVLFRVQSKKSVLIGNRSGDSTSTGWGVNLLNDSVEFGYNGSNVVTDEKRFPAINSDNFAILAMTAHENGVRVVRYTNGALDELLDLEGEVTPWGTGSTGNAIQIGGYGASNYSNARDISLAAIHEGVLTDPQLKSICEFVKVYGEQKGLTIE